MSVPFDGGYQTARTKHLSGEEKRCRDERDLRALCYLLRTDNADLVEALGLGEVRADFVRACRHRQYGGDA